MDPNDKSQSNFVFPAAIIAGLISIGMLVQVAPYDRKRPDVNDKWPETTSAAQDVVARLWEDPYASVQRHLEEIQALKDKDDLVFEKNQHDVTKIKDFLRKNRDLIIFVAFVPASPYAESAEVRRRFRYAVLSGFARVDLIPKDKGHIGYFTTLQNQKSAGEKRLRVPFEELELNPFVAAKMTQKNAVKHALVLWVDADAFSRGPLTKLDSLLSEILPEKSNIPIKVLGPLDSDSIFSLYKEGCTFEKEDPRSYPGVEVYTPTATLSDFDMKHAVLGCSDVVKVFEKLNVVRVTQTGESLLSEVLKELELRGIDPVKAAAESKKKKYVRYSGGRAQRIAVVSEWDTVYGRVTPGTMQRLVEDKLKFNNVIMEDMNWVYSFSYLRGLDGVEAESPKTKAKTEEKEGGDGKKKVQSRIERAEGNAQFDYLRRLANQIRATDEQFRSKGEQGFGAIGVLGTDFYDKLLVLQALRQAMPEKVYFTLELDTRFSHPDELEWTRNLVIASSFGLSINRSLQRNTSPFRDSRQTAAFLATLVSLSPEPLPIKQAKVRSWLHKSGVGIFEIGRTGPFEYGATREEHKCVPWDLMRCDSIAPTRPAYYGGNGRGSRAILIAATAALIGMSLVIVFFPPGHSGINWNRRAWALLILCPLTVFLVVFWPDIWMPLATFDRQPLVFYEGLSIWPTLILRIVAIIIAFILLFELIFRIRNGQESIETEFKLADEDAKFWRSKIDCTSELMGFKSRAAIKAVFQTWFQKIFVHRKVFDGCGQIETKQASQLWNRYKKLGTSSLRIWRFSLGAVAFFVLGFLVFMIWPAQTPFRGIDVFEMHFWSILICVFLLNLLMLAVLEAVWLAGQFLEKLEETGGVEWPRCRGNKITKHLNEWELVQFVASFTKSLSPVIYYPFLVLAIMLISRSSAFADWTIQPSVVIAFTWCGVLALGGAFYLRRAAETIRAHVLERLAALLIGFRGGKEEEAAKQTEIMIQEVKALKKGAFAPITQQPAIHALLISLGGVGGTYLIEFLTAVRA